MGSGNRRPCRGGFHSMRQPTFQHGRQRELRTSNSCPIRGRNQSAGSACRPTPRAMLAQEASGSSFGAFAIHRFWAWCYPPRSPMGGLFRPMQR
jgi:hypothetical protein